MGSTGQKYFTLEELQKYDGKNGGPTYLVFKGKVYDITSSQLWVKGTHMGIHDSREAIESTIKEAPHGEEVLSRFPVVGELKEAASESPVQKAVLPIPPAPATEAKMPKENETAARPVAPPEENGSPTQMPRREFFKLALTAGGVITVAALASSLKILSFVPTSTASQSWPTLKVINVSQLSPLTPVIFNYPLTNTPNILVKLGVKADNGVGPDGDIVAFSGICQHLGCFPGFQAPESSPPCNPSYKAAIPMAYCCCHGSQYDFVHGAKVIGGPAPRPLPQVVLQYDSTTGDIYAVSMTPPNIFGHGPAGTTDPTLVMQYDLSGGTVVSSS
jgi:arsenite oxidase small subunit